MKISAFKNFGETKTPYNLTVEEAINRIKMGKSKDAITRLRSEEDEGTQVKLKKQLPAICFSGEFSERKDECLIKHSGFVALDFDKVKDIQAKKDSLVKDKYVYACWISPRGNGIKALVRIADGNQHREHYGSLCEYFKGSDPVNINVSRLCFESYDPDLYLNPDAEIYKKIKITQKFESKVLIEDEQQIFNHIVGWLTNKKHNAFQQGERNIFIFKLASACCRFGLSEDATSSMIHSSINVNERGFSSKECLEAIESAYKSKRNIPHSARFEDDVLVDISSHFEVEITQEMLDESLPAQDVQFGNYVREDAFDVFDTGYEEIKGIGITELDYLFKFKTGEITLLSGYGNYGKSSFWCWKLLMRAILYGEKYAFFTPEESAVEFYVNLTEMLLGADCTPTNKYRVSRETFGKAYDFIGEHFFYVYPASLLPTPVYIKERFLELIIKKKVHGVVIDPFNQLTNDYGSAGGRTDKYLETFLSDCSRFSQQNSLYFGIIAHPKAQAKGKDGNYPCPDIFDIADGAMWNNKMDNILIYDRPNHQQDPMNDVCTLHTKKIRRQKIVGKKGSLSFNFDRTKRRFVFGGRDPMAEAILKSEFVPQELRTMPIVEKGYEKNNLQPNHNFYETDKEQYTDDNMPF